MESNKKATAISILLPIVLFLLVLTRFFGSIKYGNTPEMSIWISRVLLWIAVFITWLYANKIEKKSFLLWTEQKKKPRFYLISIIVILAGITILLYTISFTEHKFGLAENNTKLNYINELMCNHEALILFTCLTAAFTEEFIFRGYLLPRLQIVFNNIWVSIIISSVLFGLSHFGFGDFNRMLFPFIIGIIFSWVYYKYRSLAILIICHFLMDFYSLYFSCK
ncbi:MAG: type II CAAX endopeptidase family protein [Ginsengibacter sp.]